MQTLTRTRPARRLPLILIAFALSAILSSGCASKDKGAASRYTAVNEAYELLDKGQTSRAIVLLEDIVREQPGNTEARVMLASAYMGKAGIDVLSMHDAFHDVLFSKSLSDIFFKGGGGSEKKPGADLQQDPLTGAPEMAGAAGPAGVVQPTPAEKLFERVDEFLNNVRRVLVILNRFPRVQARKWALLDQALYNLDQTPLQREVRLYRMFIRLIYVKEVLVTRVIRDGSFGTRAWACRTDLDQLQDSLGWATSSLTAISQDFIEVYPREASPFAKVETLLRVFGEELAEFEADAPAGSETGTLVLQRRIREAFHCPSGPEAPVKPVGPKAGGIRK